MSESNGNGRKPPLAFKLPGSDVPIIGQPFTIDGWFPTAKLRCKCQPDAILNVPLGVEVTCPGCPKVYTIQSMAIAKDGSVQFAIGMAVPVPEQTQESIHG